MYWLKLWVAVIPGSMKAIKEILKKIFGGNLPPKIYFPVLLLILILLQAFYLLLGKTHVYVFNYFVSDVQNKYSLDFIIIVVKNILIINWQILLILFGLRIYNLSTQDIGWRSARNFWKVIIGVTLIVLFRLSKEAFFGNTGMSGCPSVTINDFWGKLHNPVAYYYLFIVPFVNPIFEELFYRGFVFTALEKRIGWVSAVLLSSIAFSAFHTTSIISFNLELFFKGVMFSLLRKWDGSIWSSVAAHSTNNLLLSWLTIRI